MFSPASLIELSVVKVLTPHHFGFQGQPLLHSSGQEMRVSSKLELKITKKKHQNHPERDIGQYYLI